MAQSKSRIYGTEAPQISDNSNFEDAWINNSGTSEETLIVVEAKFGSWPYLPTLSAHDAQSTEWLTYIST